MASIPESHHDLLQTPVATLATIGRDGRPQLTAVWFLATGDEVALSLNTSRQKTKNLVADPHCSLLILDATNPYRYLEIRGDAEIVADDDFAFAARVGEKYSSNVRDHDGPGDQRVKVVIRPARVNAVDMSG